MSRRSFAASLGLAAMLISSHAFAIVIVQNTAGTSIGAASLFLGQSFTTPSSGGPWDDITFNFFSNVPPTTPVAFGTAFLLDQEYLGTPSNLSSTTPGFVAASTGITGGMYVFPTAVVLEPDVQYFIYENGASPSFSFGSGILGGNGFVTDSTSTDFSVMGLSQNFSVSGTVVSAAAPEPSSLIVLGAALLGFGFLRRYRKNG